MNSSHSISSHALSSHDLSSHASGAHTISSPDTSTQKETNLEEYNLENLVILLVDDSKTILRSAEMFLAEKGCKVLTAEDGFESLSVISKQRPDIIFMDIMMPKLDGYQTCALIKSNDEYAEIPIVMLSSKHNLFDMARGRLSGSEQYLTKPFTHDDLVEAVITQTMQTTMQTTMSQEQETAEPELPEFV